MNMIRSFAYLCLGLTLLADNASAEEPFRPEAGKFPPVEKAKAYDGQLIFVDHANRRGSIRVTGGELMHSMVQLQVFQQLKMFRFIMLAHQPQMRALLHQVVGS